LVAANASERGLTPPIALDALDNQRQPTRDNEGAIIAYTRPIMVLIDEFSASGGDAFAAVMQDNSRAALFGYRTTGAGGNVTQWRAGSYSEAIVTLTESLMSRSFERPAKEGYPTSLYVENVGVHPDFEYDYMTQQNLFGNGKPFVDAFTATMAEHIRRFR
jgi:C-terminal processing protease CtpA/Prc